MRAVICDKAPCALERGEMRRVPANPKSAILGYHVCCPRCGFVSVAVEGKQGLIMEEDDAVTFSKPLDCLYCRVKLHLNKSVFRMEETRYVRAICYN